MGLLDKIDVTQSTEQPFVWPKLPTLSETEILIASQFPPVLRQVGFELAKGVTASLQGPEAVRPGGPNLTFVVTTADHHLQIEAPIELINAGLSAIGFSVQIETLTEDTATLVIEHLLRRPFTHLENHLDAKISVAIPDQPEPPSRMGLSVVIADQPAKPIALAATTDVLAQIKDLLSQASAVKATAEPCTSVPFLASLRTQPLEVLPQDFAALMPGDALLLPEAWTDPPAAWVDIAGALSAPVKVTAGRLQLRKALTPNIRPDQEDPKMSTTPASQPSKAAPTSDALPVQVSLELDRTDIRLGDLSRLTAGSILPFDRNIPETVRLIANGAVFAEGELVQLGDRIGVRLTART